MIESLSDSLKFFSLGASVLGVLLIAYFVFVFSARKNSDVSKTRLKFLSAILVSLVGLATVATEILYPKLEIDNKPPESNNIDSTSVTNTRDTLQNCHISNREAEELLNSATQKVIEGYYRDAIVTLNIALECDSLRNPEYYYNYKGYSYFRLNDYDSAEMNLRESLNVRNFSWAYYNLAKVYWNDPSRNRLKTFDMLSKAIELEPDRRVNLHNDYEFPGISEYPEYKRIIAESKESNKR